MGDLEDRILNGKRGDNYCSSSEGEDDDTGGFRPIKDEPNKGATASRGARPAYNTGPKGVMEDWRRFKQLQVEERNEEDEEMVNLAKKLSMTCRTQAEDAEAKKAEEEGFDDEFMKAYAKKRIAEMNEAIRDNQGGWFGVLHNIADADQFLQVTDDSHHTTVVVHIYSNSNPTCQSVNASLKCLSKEYANVKFCQVLASVLGTTQRFQSQALPTLQAYRHGELIASMVRIQDELGEEIFADKLCQYLVEHGVLPDSPFVSSASKIRQSVQDESDSDFELD